MISGEPLVCALKEDELSDNYDSPEDWWKRTRRGQYQHEAIERKRSVAYKPAPRDPNAPDEFEAVPPGKYNVVVESLELKYSQKEGNAYVSWEYVIAEGEQKNRRVWNNTSLLQKSVNMPGGWYKSIEAAMADDGTFASEVAGTSYEDEEGMTEIVADRVVSRILTVAVSNRMFEGKKQSDVVAVFVYKGELPQLDTEELAEAKGPAKRPKKSAAKSDDF